MCGTQHTSNEECETMPLRDYFDAKCTATHDAYVGVPLADLSASARGDALEGVVRRVLEQRTGEAATDPFASTTVSGRKRGRNSAAYDFELSGRRVEVKSAQLTWDKHKSRWTTSWQNIKPDEHDDLYLALYTPSGVYIFLHDGVYGVSTQGKAQAACGGTVHAYGRRSEPSIAKATVVVCEKLAPMLVAYVPREQLDVSERTTTHDTYVGVPLADLSTKARGDALEGVVRRVLEQRAGEAATDPVASATVSGRKRGRFSAAYDFQLSDRRVEVKSAQLTWDKHKSRWTAAWQHIKPGEHDDLYLALYTPSGVHIYLHDGVYGVSTRGKAQAANGGKVVAYGRCYEASIAKATAVVCEKLAPMLVAHLAYASSFLASAGAEVAALHLNASCSVMDSARTSVSVRGIHWREGIASA